MKETSLPSVASGAAKPPNKATNSTASSRGKPSQSNPGTVKRMKSSSSVTSGSTTTNALDTKPSSNTSNSTKKGRSSSVTATNIQPSNSGLQSQTGEQSLKKVKIVATKPLGTGVEDTSRRRAHEDVILSFMKVFGDKPPGLTATSRVIHSTIKCFVTDLIRISSRKMSSASGPVLSAAVRDLLFYATIDPARRQRVDVFRRWIESGRKETLELFQKECRDRQLQRSETVLHEDLVHIEMRSLFEKEGIISKRLRKSKEETDDQFFNDFQSFIRARNFAKAVMTASNPSEESNPSQQFGLWLQHLLVGHTLRKESIELIGFLVWDTLRCLTHLALKVKHRQDQVWEERKRKVEFPADVLECTNKVLITSNTSLVPEHVREALRIGYNELLPHRPKVHSEIL